MQIRSSASFVAFPSSYRPPISHRTYAGILLTFRCSVLRSPENARYLISVDRDLLDLRSIQEIPIVRPGEYWRRTALFA